MSHTVLTKKKLLARVRRIKGQVSAVENMLDAEHDCYAVLQTISACRGAINGLMYEIIEGHIQHHVHDSTKKLTDEQAKATQQLLDVVRSYLK